MDVEMTLTRRKRNGGVDSIDDDEAAALLDNRDASAASRFNISTTTKKPRPSLLSSPAAVLLSWAGGQRRLVLLTVFIVALSVALSSRFLSRLAFLQVVTSLPLIFSFLLCIWPGRPTYKRFLPFSLVATTVSVYLPSAVATAIATSITLLFSLATHVQPVFPKTEAERKTVETFDKSKSKQQLLALASALAVVSMLLVENFMIWVVSATFVPGQRADTAPSPLQDNGRLLMEYLFNGGGIPEEEKLSKSQLVRGLRHMWNVQWGLVSTLAGSAMVIEVLPTLPKSWSQGNPHTYPLFAMISRSVLSLAVARLIRTVSFCLTVLPSQMKNCYALRFPYPPPTDVWEWIFIGLKPASHGGCNDLIVSGHATVTSTMACFSTSVTDDPLFGLALWTMVVLDYSMEVYEGFHYSVDMFLGLLLVTLIYRALKPITDFYDKVERPPVHRVPLTSQTLAAYAIPSLGVYLQLTVMPNATANFVVVAYLIAGTVLFGIAQRHKDPNKRNSYVHLAQHVWLSLMYMAFGIYL